MSEEREVEELRRLLEELPEPGEEGQVGAVEPSEPAAAATEQAGHEAAAVGTGAQAEEAQRLEEAGLEQEARKAPEQSFGSAGGEASGRPESRGADGGGLGGRGAVPEAPSERVFAAPAERPNVEDVRRRLEEALRVYREVVSVARELASLPPEEKAWVHSVVNTLVQQPQPRVVEKPVIVEKEKPVVVEKPVPVKPPELEEVRRELDEVRERAKAFEEGLRLLDERIKVLEELSMKTTQVMETIARALERERSLEEELRQLRKELEEMRRNPAGQMVVPRAEKLNPDGSIVREYDYHPMLKARLKQVEFATERLGPTLIEEIRATRQELASIGNRLVTLFEAALLPELKKRAPKIVEEVQEAARKLVKRLTPEEREKELGEIEKRVEERLGGGKA